MRPSKFLEWFRYKKFGGKRMYANYAILRKFQPKLFKKLEDAGRFKQEETMGRLLKFPDKKI
jgi:hypothetical protein